MKILNFVWVDHEGKANIENFRADQFRVSTEAGWVRLRAVEGNELLRIMPAERIVMIQWVEQPEKSAIIHPSEVISGPRPT